MTDPLEYFQACLEAYPHFKGFQFECEDKNLKAFESKEAFGKWYGQPPGQVGEPYRDEGFYVRDLAQVSMDIQPSRIVEIGTSLGIGTLLLRILNPKAHITSVDNRNWVPAGDGKEYPVGVLAINNGSKHTQEFGDSEHYRFEDVEMFFIDGDHSYDAVVDDSENAWHGKSPSKWAIVWHDYNDRHPGAVQAVNEFCAKHKLILTRKPDSSTVWCTSKDNGTV